jgi:hypothetical protein
VLVHHQASTTTAAIITTSITKSSRVQSSSSSSPFQPLSSYRIPVDHHRYQNSLLVVMVVSAVTFVVLEVATRLGFVE